MSHRWTLHTHSISTCFDECIELPRAERNTDLQLSIEKPGHKSISREHCQNKSEWQFSHTQIPMLTSEHVTRFHPNMLPSPSNLKSKRTFVPKHCYFLHLTPDGMCKSWSAYMDHQETWVHLAGMFITSVNTAMSWEYFVFLCLRVFECIGWLKSSCHNLYQSKANIGWYFWGVKYNILR